LGDSNAREDVRPVDIDRVELALARSAAVLAPRSGRVVS
jgi:hypothetical protein